MEIRKEILNINFDLIQDSIIALEAFDLDGEILTKDEEEYVLRESIVNGNYFSYDFISDLKKSDETDLAMATTSISRIEEWKNSPTMINFKKDLDQTLNPIIENFKKNPNDRTRCYEFFKQYAMAHFMFKMGIV